MSNRSRGALMRKSLVLFSLFLILAGSAKAAEPAAPAEASAIETPAQRDARMQWWREARFGMFIHWGIYSVPAGVYKGQPVDSIGEWIQNIAMIPTAEYAAYADQFNPIKFNAEEWVRLAREAGMKYIVITSKHHDGFAMYHSKVSDYNIYNRTPFKRDPLKELADACARQGIKLGFYYSQSQDWYHPGGGVIKPNPRELTKWDPAQEGDYDTYLQTIAIPQLKEILTNYGKIAVLWWDTPLDLGPERARQFSNLLALQPGIISNNRLGGAAPGDTETPEQYIPANGFPGRDWETCMTMNDTWGYKSNDHNWKSTETLIRNLVDIASKGGNFLLNVGPTAEGEIPAESVERLRQIGDWMQVNGESIYGGGPVPLHVNPSWGRVTRRGSHLYVHIFQWPASGSVTVPVLTPVRSARLLGAPSATLTVASDPQGFTVQLPSVPVNPIDSVISVELSGPPEVIEAPPLKPAADGSLTLGAAQAVLEGANLMVETIGGVENIGRWLDQKDSASWPIFGLKAARFDVMLTYSLAADAPSRFAFELAGQRIEGEIQPTAGWGDFQTVTAGTIELAENAEAKAKLSNLNTSGALMNLRSISLKPVLSQ